MDNWRPCLPEAAASIWNSLPESVRSSPSLPVLRSRLKTELFARSYSSPVTFLGSKFYSDYCVTLCFLRVLAVLGLTHAKGNSSIIIIIIIIIIKVDMRRFRGVACSNAILFYVHWHFLCCLPPPCIYDDNTVRPVDSNQLISSSLNNIIIAYRVLQ